MKIKFVRSVNVFNRDAARTVNCEPDAKMTQLSVEIEVAILLVHTFYVCTTYTKYEQPSAVNREIL